MTKVFYNNAPEAIGSENFEEFLGNYLAVFCQVISQKIPQNFLRFGDFRDFWSLRLQSGPGNLSFSQIWPMKPGHKARFNGQTRA